MKTAGPSRTLNPRQLSPSTFDQEHSLLLKEAHVAHTGHQVATTGDEGENIPRFALAGFTQDNAPRDLRLNLSTPVAQEHYPAMTTDTPRRLPGALTPFDKVIAAHMERQGLGACNVILMTKHNQPSTSTHGFPMVPLAGHRRELSLLIAQRRRKD